MSDGKVEVGDEVVGQGMPVSGMVIGWRQVKKEGDRWRRQVSSSQQVGYTGDNNNQCHVGQSPLLAGHSNDPLMTPHERVNRSSRRP